MVKKVWKCYINQMLNDFEQDETNVPEGDNKLNIEADLSNTSYDNTNKLWCKTIERSFAYTFESFCKWVVCSTIKSAVIKKKYEISSIDIDDCIQRLFNTKIDDHPPTHKYNRDPHKFKGYIRWLVNKGYNQRLIQCRYPCNMSVSRKLLIIKESSSKHNFEEESTNFSIEKYKVLKPIHKTKNYQ